MDTSQADSTGLVDPGTERILRVRPRAKPTPQASSWNGLPFLDTALLIVDPRLVVEHILASLRRSSGDFEPRDCTPPIEPAELASLRELFVAAGTEAVARAVSPPQWLQVGVRFHDHVQHARFLHERLGHVVGGWLDDGTIDRFSFMNKDPGCRLRFRCKDPEAGFRERLMTFLEREVADERAIGLERGTYEPEAHQFGGTLGLELCHELFTLESRAVLELGHLRDSGRTSVDPVVFSLFLVNALLRRVVGDRWEIWDTWMHMDLTGRRVELDQGRRAELMAELADQRDVLEVLALEPESLCEELDDVERPVAQRYLDGIDFIAGRLVTAASAGQLCFGLREILPFCIVFHWNRMRFDHALQCTLVFYMTQILSPKTRRSAGEAQA
jgi:thiopeptide-type bacteriocin biosynthesis protein